jgi:hypothetical protein
MTTCLNFTLYSEKRFFSWLQSDLGRLSQLCHKLSPHFSIELIRLAEERQRAFHDGVTVAPAILVEMPDGQRRNLGGFDQVEKFLTDLNRKTCQHNQEPSPTALQL